MYVISTAGTSAFATGHKQGSRIHSTSYGRTKPKLHQCQLQALPTGSRQLL